MQVEIIVRKNHTQWGGDMNVINQLVEGIQAWGIDAKIQPDIEKIKEGSKVILTNTCLDQRQYAAYLLQKKFKYSVLPFHEDFKKYFVNSFGVIEAITALLGETKYHDFPITIELLEKYPELISYGNFKPPSSGLLNMEVLSYADYVFPSSIQEEETVKRDSPDANTSVIYYSTDLEEKFKNINKNLFSEKYGIKEKYIIQVGRLESRKNQIYTVLACRDIPVPLVFIATKGYQNWYTELLVKVILKYRKYPTYIISQDMENQEVGLLKIKKMDKGEKLSWDVLGSAYAGALVNVHPAFYELPGLTYLESIYLGIKTICSKDASIKEYIDTEKSKDGLFFVSPNNLSQIRNSIIESIYGLEPMKAQLRKISQKDYASEIIREISK
jgi:glycosyltransferase involved in cell wall biosynthesis